MEGGVAAATPKKTGHISEMVKASLTKLSDILHLAIPLHLRLFGAKSHVYVSHRRLRETGVSSQKCF